jgi:phenylacetate-CoA ligase
MTKFLYENRVWDEVEALPLDQLQALQLERLQQTVSRVAERVPFYKE